jgi:hypothetical protein
MRHSLLFLLALLDADLIRAALRHADISITKAAVWMECDRALLERQLDGEGHLSHRRLLMLPLSFHRWMNFLGSIKYGLPSEVRRSAPLQLAVMGQRRMLRAELHDRKERTA